MDEETSKHHWRSIPQLDSYAAVMKTIKQLAESLVTILLQSISSTGDSHATLVIDCCPFYPITNRMPLKFELRGNIKDNLRSVIPNLVVNYAGIFSQLKDAVQVRAIKETYGGGMGNTPCKNPVFEAGLILNAEFYLGTIRFRGCI